MARNTQPTTFTHEQAARYGAKANAMLGAVQFAVGVSTGNFGFVTEAAHQAADSASFQAKANAMNHNCSPIKARRLRKLAASVLVVGGLAGIGGGIHHLKEGSREAHSWIEISGAVLGAGVNTAIAKRSHGAKRHGDQAQHTDHTHEHSHQEGATVDSLVHTMTDMGTGWLYATALSLESRAPGLTNYALGVNGTIVGIAGIHTFFRIHTDHVQQTRNTQPLTMKDTGRNPI